MPVGRFRWLRLSFGIKSAPEIFQRIMDTMLESIGGARAVMDDILVARKDEAQLDRIMDHFPFRQASNRVEPQAKLQVKQRKVKYVGHLVTRTLTS